MFKNESKKILLVFFIMFIFVLFQHHFMWLYHDDYGYASLSYVGNIYKTNPDGYHTTLLNIFKFCQFHYNNWGGRVLYFFFECNIMRLGIHGYRIIQSAVIVLIFYYMYKILSYIFKKEDFKLAVFIAFLYGAFEIMTFRDGIFWFTASILYIFPLLPFLMFIYYYVLKEKNKKVIEIILSSLLVLLASFSQEQISAMVVSFIGLYEIVKIYKNRKFDFKDLPIIIAALIGFGLLLFCPGSKVRMGMTSDFYNLSMFGKLKLNIPNIIENNFGTYTKIFSLLFFSTLSYISYDNYKNEKEKFNIINVLSFISNMIILFFMMTRVEGYFSYFRCLKSNHIYLALYYLIIAIQFALIMYSVVVYFVRKKQVLFIQLFISGIATQVVMLIAPYFPLRSAMIMQFVYFLIIGYVAYELIKKHGLLLFIPLFAVLFINYSTITYGYIGNDKNNQYNHNELIKASKEIKKGQTVERIKLKRLNDSLYASNMPYDENYDYINIYIRAYYQLPEDLVIEYE